jgi:hypothetical protein
MEEKGVLVDSGYLRVDRKRALRKLANFQLPESGWFLLAWVRAGVAAGAKEIRVRTLADGIEVKFSGKVFTQSELLDPYQALFAEGEEAPARSRFLAVGILSALRLKPRKITVASGKGYRRHVLTARALEDDSVSRLRDEGTETVIRALWTRATAPGRAWKHLLHISKRCAMTPVPFFLSGKKAASAMRDAPPEALVFRADEMRGVLSAPGGAATSSLLRLYHHGVWVCDKRVRLNGPQVIGIVDSEKFALNASHSGVAENRAFGKMKEVLAAEVQRLIIATADRLRRHGAQTTPGALSNNMTVAWLREAARNSLSRYSVDSRRPAGAALWRAPLLCDTRGRVLSLLDLQRQRGALGFVPHTKSKSSRAPGNFRVAWVDAEGQRLVRRLFMGTTRAV